MRVISVCSGAGGLDLGLERAGHRTIALCEADPWRQRLLAARFPGVPVWPDLETLDPADLPDAGLLAGGTPCQDLSVAGRRAGLDGARSGLYWHYQRVRLALGIEWALWENVAGALSSNNGLDFASVLGAFVGADVVVPAGGWPGAGVVAGPWGGAVWRVLDAQHFGVPQRRRRVFVVGRLGGPCPPEILFELAGGGGDPAARRGARQGTASPLEDGTGIARTLSTSNQRIDADTESFVVNGPVSTLQARGSTGGFDVDPAMAAGGHLITGTIRSHPRPGSNDSGNVVAHTLRSEGFDASEDGTGRGTPLTVVDGAAPDADGVRAPDGMAGRVDGAVSFAENQRGEVLAKPIMDSLKVGGGKPGQGYPAVMGHGTETNCCAYDPQPDGRRYAACGDGVVANVAEWIGRRIQEATA